MLLILRFRGGIKGTIKSGKTLNLKLKKSGDYEFSVKIQNSVRQRPGAEKWLKYDVSHLLEELEIKIFDSKNREIINNDYVEPVRRGRYGQDTELQYKPPKRITRFKARLIASESYRLVFKPMINSLKKEKYFLIAKFKALPTRLSWSEIRRVGRNCWNDLCFWNSNILLEDIPLCSSAGNGTG